MTTEDETWCLQNGNDKVFNGKCRYSYDPINSAIEITNEGKAHQIFFRNQGCFSL
jgi:hypothetical protein